jgi:hypothetical protein
MMVVVDEAGKRAPTPAFMWMVDVRAASVGIGL